MARTEARTAHGPVGGDGAGIPLHTPALRPLRPRPPDSGPSALLWACAALAEEPGQSLPRPHFAGQLGGSRAAGPTAEPWLPQCVLWPAPSCTRWVLILGVPSGAPAALGGVQGRWLCPTPAGPRGCVAGRASRPGAGSASRGAIQAAGLFCYSWGRGPGAQHLRSVHRAVGVAGPGVVSPRTAATSSPSSRCHGDRRGGLALELQLPGPTAPSSCPPPRGARAAKDGCRLES